MEYIDNFNELSMNEVEMLNGGGVVTAVAGGIAGALIGTHVGLVPAVVSGDASYVTKAAIAGAAGAWAGLGCPCP